MGSLERVSPGLCRIPVTRIVEVPQIIDPLTANN
jgi:hypothetical protein